VSEPGTASTTFVAPPFAVIKEPPDPVRSAEYWLAFGTAVVLGFGVHYRLSPDVSPGLLLAIAFLPVTYGMRRRYQGTSALTLLVLLAAASGLVLTWVAATDGYVDHSRAIVQTARVLELGFGTLALLWARAVVGPRVTVLAYTLGLFMGLGVVGLDPDNYWKFSLSVPVTLLVLALPNVFGRPRAEIAALVGLGAVSALNDSRSATALMLIAATLLITQVTRDARGSRTLKAPVRGASVLLRLVLVAVGGFYLTQSLILDGTLGEAAKQRTVEQIQTSGSVLLGGRPELGASAALILHQPWGYGAGALATGNDVLIAKTGMADIGYDPNNGYVEKYMFGLGFEVHSMLGDMWVLYGIAGMLLALLVVALTLTGIARALQRNAASGAMLFLAVYALWDFAFSPFPSAMANLMLELALVLPLAARHKRGEQPDQLFVARKL
jgi:hypothetical protein